MGERDDEMMWRVRNSDWQSLLTWQHRYITSKERNVRRSVAATHFGGDVFVTRAVGCPGPSSWSRPRDYRLGREMGEAFSSCCCCCKYRQRFSTPPVRCHGGGGSASRIVSNPLLPPSRRYIGRGVFILFTTFVGSSREGFGAANLLQRPLLAHVVGKHMPWRPGSNQPASKRLPLERHATAATSRSYRILERWRSSAPAFWGPPCLLTDAASYSTRQ